MMNDAYFQMTVEDIFFIRGRGTVVTGVISKGTINVGDIVTLIGDYCENIVQVARIELFRRRTDSASAGERVGIFLMDITPEEIARGDLLERGNPHYDDILREVEDGT